MCSVISCKNTRANVKNLAETIRFHRFPQDVSLQAQWMEACGVSEIKGK